MKAALCLYGIVGGTDGKDGKGKNIPFEECYESYRKHIISINDADIFIHSWSCDVEKELISLYQPKKYKFQEQIKFEHEREDGYRALSRWYSTKQAIELKRKYEEENNFEYDCVMLTRFDTLFFVDLDFSKYNLNCLWVPHWNTPQGLPNKPNIKADRTNRSLKRNRFSDMWYFSNSKLINEFAKIYKGVRDGKYAISQHQAAWDCLVDSGYNRKDFKYTLYRFFDFDLYRWKILRNFYAKGDGHGN